MFRFDFPLAALSLHQYHGISTRTVTVNRSGNERSVPRTNHFVTRAGKEYAADIDAHIERIRVQQYGGTLPRIDGRVGVRIDIFWLCANVEDVDNGVKPFLDCVKRKLFTKDDAWIYELTMTKHRVSELAHECIILHLWNLPEDYAPPPLVPCAHEKFISLPVVALSQNAAHGFNARGPNGVRAFCTRETLVYRNAILDALMLQNAPFIQGCVRLRVHVFMSRQIGRRDVDNVVKQLLDALKEKLFGDDAFVAQVVARKLPCAPGDDRIDLCICGTRDTFGVEKRAERLSVDFSVFDVVG